MGSNDGTLFCCVGAKGCNVGFGVTFGLSDGEPLGCVDGNAGIDTHLVLNCGGTCSRSAGWFRSPDKSH